MTETVQPGQTADSFIRDLVRLRGVPCVSCGEALCAHQVLMGIAIGFKNSPRCLPCLGTALNVAVAGLRDDLFRYLRQRECYAGAWNWANREAGLPDGVMPSTLLALGREAPDVHPLISVNPNSPIESVTASWDAGDQGCGELVLELRMRIERLEPGQIFQLTARDPGAPEDLPAWCRLTGHTLLRAGPPHYWIQRRHSSTTISAN